jgi:hypothetical protein
MLRATAATGAVSSGPRNTGVLGGVAFRKELRSAAAAAAVAAASGAAGSSS